MKKLFFVLLMSIISGCSGYKTNSSITFNSTDVDGMQPNIYVGEVTEKPEDLELLGWIEANVTKPHVFAEDPTEEQAAIVLAKKGEELGANAVVYVTFKKLMTSGLLRKVTARGQAVRLKAEVLQAVNAAHESTAIKPPVPTSTKNDVLPSDALVNNTNATESNQTATNTNDISTAEKIMQTPVTSWIKNKSAVSLQKELEYKASHIEKVVEVPECKTSINEIVDYEYKVQTYNFMLSNAKYLLKKTRALKDEEMQLASERLIRQITQQQEWLKTQKPKE